MSKPFAASGDASVAINSAEIAPSQIVMSAVGLTLPEDFGRHAQEKADLLERRLNRIEEVLGLQPICAD